MSNMSLFLSTLESKLLSSPFLNGNEQLLFTEETDLLKKGLVFPRMNLVIDKLKGSGYISQRQMDFAFRFYIVGYLKFPGKDGDMSWKPSRSNYVELVDFATNTASLTYSLMDDHQAGIHLCKGFQMFSGFPEIFIEPELLPKILSFSVYSEAIITQNDTEEL